MTNPVWTPELRATCGDLVTRHHSADVVSRAREIWHGANVGQKLSAMNVEFITSMRSRFGDQRDLISPALERAFDAAWGAAWDAAK